MTEKFLLVSPDFPPPLIGGSLVYIKTLAEYSEYDVDILTSQNHTFQMETISSPHKVLRKELITSSNNPSLSKLILSYIYMFAWIAIKMITRKYKLVIANPGVVGNSMIFLLGKIMRVKVVGIAYAEELTIPLKRNDFKSFLKRSLMSFAYKKAEGFIVVCHFCRNILIDQLGVDKEKIDVIPSCLTLEKFDLDSNQEPTNIQNKITSVGRLIERKGFHFLIEAVARLRADIKDVRLNIVGHGPMKDMLENQIRDLDAFDYITILDQLDDKELSRIYSETDLFVLANYQLTNGDTEGCPSVFSEAMAYGIPVIGGTGAGVETAILDGQNGFIVNSYNNNELSSAIKKILTNKSLFKFMSANAKKKLLRDHHPDIVGTAFNKSLYRFLCDKEADKIQSSFNKEVPSL